MKSHWNRGAENGQFSEVRPIVREDDFESNPNLFTLIRETTTIQAMIPSRFVDQAETIIARHSERRYVQAIAPYLWSRLRRPSELTDDVLNDVRFMKRNFAFAYGEAHFEMQRRQWFSDWKRGITRSPQFQYKPLASALGTIVALAEPRVAKTWGKEFAQRIDAWAKYEHRANQACHLNW